VANRVATFDSTAWTFDNDFQVSFDDNSGQTIHVNIINTLCDVSTNRPITFDSTAWTFDNDFQVSFDSNGEKININYINSSNAVSTAYVINIDTLSAESTTYSVSVDTLSIESRVLSSIFDALSVVSTVLSSKLDLASVISSATTTSVDSSAPVTNILSSIFDALSVVSNARTNDIDTSTSTSTAYTVNVDTNAFNWLENVPAGTALIFKLNNEIIYLASYLGSESGQIVLYQAEEISTGGDKFGYASRNSDNVVSLSLLLDESEMDDLFNFFGTITNGMANSFELLDAVDASASSVRFAQPTLENTEDDGMFSVSFDLRGE